MLKEFKEFALRGNVIDMAVGIIVGKERGSRHPVPALHFRALTWMNYYRSAEVIRAVFSRKMSTLGRFEKVFISTLSALFRSTMN